MFNKLKLKSMDLSTTAKSQTNDIALIFKVFKHKSERQSVNLTPLNRPLNPFLFNLNFLGSEPGFRLPFHNPFCASSFFELRL